MIIGYYNLLYICSIYNIWQILRRVYGGVDYCFLSDDRHPWHDRGNSQPSVCGIGNMTLLREIC